MLDIKKLDEIIELANKGVSTNLKDAGVNGTLYWAYRESKELGRDTIDFSDVVWDYDIEPIITALRDADYLNFTISSKSSSLLDVLSKMTELGCSLGGIVQVKQRWKTYNYETGEESYAYEPGMVINL